jgi:hypothetical protein
MDRPKLEVADVFRRYGEAYRQEHGASLSIAQRRVMTAIEVCQIMPFSAAISSSVTTAAISETPITRAGIATAQNASLSPASNGSRSVRPNS